MIFEYPGSPHERRHGPQGYRAYTEYKPWLRDEFAFRCVYCLRRERFFPDGEWSFGVDHVVPQSVNPAGVTDYDNLVYACTRCNTLKGEVVGLLSPDEAGFGRHLRVEPDGTIRTLTSEGRRLVGQLELNSVELTAFRRRFLLFYQVVQLPRNQMPADVAEILDVLHAFFTYPDAFPHLSRLRPPDGNRRPVGIDESHFERRLRGELPPTY